MTNDTASDPYADAELQRGGGSSVVAAVPISHVGLSVPDIEAAIQWYRDVLGFLLIEGPHNIDLSSSIADIAKDIYGSQWGAMRQAHLASANGVGLELFQFIEPRGYPADHVFRYQAPGFFHLCVVCDNVEALASRIASAGGRQRTAVHRPSPRYSLCYCEDPWGNALEINDRDYTDAHGRPSENATY